MLKKIFTRVENIATDVKFLMRIQQTSLEENIVQDNDQHIRNLPAKSSVDLDDFNRLLEDENIFAAVVSFLDFRYFILLSNINT